MTRVRFQLDALIVDQAEHFGPFFDPTAEAGAEAEWRFNVNGFSYSHDVRGGERISLHQSARVVDGVNDDLVAVVSGIEEDDAPNADDELPKLWVRLGQVRNAGAQFEFESPPHKYFRYRLAGRLISDTLPYEIVATPSGVWHGASAVIALTRGPERHIELQVRDAAQVRRVGTTLSTTTGASITSNGTALFAAHTSTELGPNLVRVTKLHTDGASLGVGWVLCEATVAPAIGRFGDELWLAVSGKLVGFSFGPTPPPPQVDRIHLFRSVDGGLSWGVVASTNETTVSQPSLHLDHVGTPWIAWVGTEGQRRLNLARVALNASRDSGTLEEPPALSGVADTSASTPAVGFVGSRPIIGWVGTDSEQRRNQRLLVDATAWAGTTRTDTASSEYGPAFMPPNPNGKQSGSFIWVNGDTVVWEDGFAATVYIGSSSTSGGSGIHK